MTIQLGIQAQNANSLNFITLSDIIATANENTACPSIKIPDGKALTVRSNPNNLGDVYISNSDSTNSSTRVTLAPGDGLQLFVKNSNVIFTAVSVANERIDLVVEQQ